METSVSNQNVTTGAGSADCGSGVSSVKGASDDVGDEGAGVTVGEVETLLTVDAVTSVVNRGTSITTISDTSITDLVVQVG